MYSVLCPTHRDGDRWPAVGGGHGRLVQHCAGCRALSDTIVGDRTNLWIRVLPDLTNIERDDVNAVHEAAHAVVGLRAGMVGLQEVSVRPANRGDGKTGHVLWHTWGPDRMSVVASTWAGQDAGLRWLRDHPRYDTAANRLDIHTGANHDATLADTFAPPGTVHYAAGRDRASAMVDEHWDAIRRLADELLVQERMTGAEVMDLVG